MCGIVGYVGKGNALPILIDGLKRLEYRGYDSAGIAYQNGKGIEIYKTKGKIRDLQENHPIKHLRCQHRHRTYQMGNPRDSFNAKRPPPLCRRGRRRA